MDRWAWEQLDPWLEIRRQLPIGAVLCVIHGPTAGRPRATSAPRPPRTHSQAKPEPTRTTTRSPSEPPYHPHIQYANLGITSVYLQGIDNSEIISTVHGRPSPTISATAGLQMTR
jgi:hypothetical protein